MTPAPHTITRHRHDLRRRSATVLEVRDLTPRMRRITLASPDLHDFTSLAPDDHVRLFFAQADGAEPVTRDFTPRAYDNARQTITLDFALHGAGPASEWASAAAPGATLDIGGPRGSFIVPDDFDWYLLAGDESALPAIGRRVEQLRPGVPVLTAVLLADEGERQVLATGADWQAHWVCRGEPGDQDGALLLEALRPLALPPGDGFVWIAGEKEMARSVRAYFEDERRHPHDWIKAASYWSRTDGN